MQEEAFNWANVPTTDLDWQASIELAHGQEKIAKQIYTMLLDKLDQFKIDLQREHSEKQISKLLECVHKLHGGLCYLGAPRLRYLSYHLETACKQANIALIDDIMAQYIGFMDILKTKLENQLAK